MVPVPGNRLPPTTRRTVGARLAAVLANDMRFDCAFVHRDAEAQEPERRHEEVARASRQSGFEGSALAVVPVRMTEAWLLLDEAEIRRVAGRPRGGSTLDLPPLHKVESVADPKSLLQELLKSASGHRGRRLKTFRQQFGSHRRQLLESLDIDGPVNELRAWQRLRCDLHRLLERLDPQD